MFIKLIDVTTVALAGKLGANVYNRDCDRCVGANRGRDCRVDFAPTLNDTIVICEYVFLLE